MRVRAAVASIVLGLAVGLLAVPAHAADGSAGPDPTYAGDGTLDLAASRAPMVLDAQDRLLVLTSTGNPGARLSRYLPSGSADAAFTPLDLPTVVASASRLAVLDDGSISLVESRLPDGDERIVRRISPAGQLVAAYGTGGILHIAVDQPQDPFLDRADGTIVTVRRASGAVEVRRYDATGSLDPAFGGDGMVDLTCCGAGDGPPQLQALQPDGPSGALIALVRRGSAQALVPIAADGAVGPEQAVPVASWATTLWAVPTGGFFLGVQAGPADATGQTSVHLDGQLAADGGPADPGSAYLGAAQVERAGSRTFVATSSGATARVTAFDAGGVDRSYGTGGTVVTEAMLPENSDAVGLSSSAAVGVAPDGRILVSSSSGWGPGFVYPYYQYAQRVDAYAPDGRRLHRWDNRGTPDAVASVVAEAGGRGFLVQSTVTSIPGPFAPHTTSPRVRRWIPPDEQAALGPVRDLTVAITGSSATVSWTPPAVAPGLLVTGYEVRYAVAGTAAATKEVAATSTSVALGSTEPLTVHRFEVRAKGIGGALGPVATVLVIPPLPSVGAFLDQLATGFGTGATAEEQAHTAGLLGDGSATPPGLVLAGAQSPGWRTSVDPVVRLYLAYFQRPPDPSGLRYWTAKRRTGTTVARISAVFADSSEFERTYGSLTNRRFVELVYANVLGRPGDPSGVAYWTSRLDRRVTSRGHLMASFSESSEHVRRRRAVVDVVSIHLGLLGRTPTAAELTRWSGPAPEGDAAAMAAAILQSTEYVERLG